MKRHYKKIDCITFFDNNLLFEIRYNVLKEVVDYFLICESIYDHRGKIKKKNFIMKKYYDKSKIKYILHNKPFPKKASPWKKQAIQRDYILKNLEFTDNEDYILFSDADEIPNPKTLKNITLKKKYGIFLQKCFNYKFNLFNKYESPWEGTRICKRKDLKSIDFMRQKVVSKNLRYNFFRLDKERNLELYKEGGWHFTNMLTPKDISKKLKTFAHVEFSKKKYSSIQNIRKNIKNHRDLFGRGHIYERVKLNHNFPEYIRNNLKKFKKFLI